MTATLAVLSLYLFFSVLLAGFFAAYALSKGTTHLVKIFAILCSLISIYLFGYLLELNSSSLAQMIFWNHVQYLAIPFYPAFWLLLSLVYSKKVNWISRRVIISIFAIPLFTYIIRLTNPLHNLYYRSIGMKSIRGLSFLDLEKGSWYYIYSLYLVFYFALSLFYYIRTYPKRGPSEQAGYIIMITSSALPFVGLALIITDPGNLGLNYVAPLLLFSLFLVLRALFKYDFLELKTLARQTSFEKSIDAILLIDVANRITDYNPAAVSLFQELKFPVKGRPIKDVLNQQTAFLESLELSNKKDLKIANADGYGYFEIKIVDMEDSHGNRAGRLITLNNITERKHAQEILNVLATTDALTGLNNRGHFMDLAKIAMNDSQKNCRPFSLIMMDIDRFKSINDTFGHAAGDAVLRYTTDKMTDSFNKLGTIGRIGGEEFAIILPGIGLQEAVQFSEEFRKTISNTPVLYENIKISLTVSIGVSTYNSKFNSLDELLKLADKALYESKSNGRNRTTAMSLE